jgi:hypothetical protein
LEQHNRDVAAARQSLRLPRTTFNRYLVALDIEIPEPTAKDSRPPERLTGAVQN